MKRDLANKGGIPAAVGTAAHAVAQAQPERKRPEKLIADLMNPDEVTHASACDAAPDYGAAAVRPLAFSMGTPDFELGRRCKRALYKIVRHAGRPGAENEATAVEGKLVPLVSNTMLPVQVRRDLLWMLSEIGTTSAVEPIAALLADKELRDDARCVLMRLPCPEAGAALKQAFAGAPEEFKFALADSLRSRGEKVEGYPSKKLVPTAQTTVTALQPKK